MEVSIELNPNQQQAVLAGLGPVMILAGPGSGKTRVLTQRVAYLISAMNVQPDNILAVTFTNKAAREMESRLIGLIGEAAHGLTLGTFHSICARLLRREAKHLPFASNFVIFDEDDQVRLVKRVLEDLNLDEKRYRAPGVLNAISMAKNELLGVDDFPIQTYRDEVIRRVYKRYQELLLANNALDFDDLLLWAVRLFEEKPEARRKYARRYEHILVDEFQDTNLAQYMLLKHLSTFHNNIFVVGDIDQSIYRWRGADYRNVLRFEKDFPDAQVILLEQNYRSTQAILDVAMAVIDRHPLRTPKRLFTDRGAGEKVTLFEAYDDRTEAAYVLDIMATLVQQHKAVPGDFAIMYRTNAQSRILEEAFLHANIPYRLVGAQRFYGRKEIKDIIAYLRLVHNPDDEISLSRAINVPPRGIGEKTYYALYSQAKQAKCSPGALLLELAQDQRLSLLDDIPGRGGGALSRFGNLLAKWISQKHILSPLSLMDSILEDIKYHDYINDGSEEGQDRWDNVMEFRRLSAEYQEQGLEAFLEQVSLVSDQDTLVSSNNAPTLLTLHAAKGLEFPVVFIVGLNDGVLPHSRSFDDPEGMMEERRLLYVGITRAKDRLYLTFAQNRSAFGYTEPVIPSRFLDDIPYGLLNEMQPTRTRGGIPAKIPSKPERWQIKTGATQSVTNPEPRYRPGMRVLHPVWGEGMVLNSRIQDNDEVVDIFFENLGLKRVVASMARLKSIE